MVSNNCSLLHRGLLGLRRMNGSAAAGLFLGGRSPGGATGLGIGCYLSAELLKGKDLAFVIDSDYLLLQRIWSRN